MPDWVWVVGFFALYIVLTQWLLPKLGVSDLSNPKMRRRVSAQDCR
jgi:hypothetical protein